MRRLSAFAVGVALGLLCTVAMLAAQSPTIGALADQIKALADQIKIIAAPPPPPALPPVLGCPGSQIVSTTGVGLAVVYPPPSVSGGVAPVLVSSLPASGSVFPIGATSVKATAVDAVGQAATPCSFTVTVTKSTPPSTSCGMQLADTPPVFCDTFNKAFPVTGRSGELDPVLWGVSRIGTGGLNQTSTSTMVLPDGSSYTAQPGLTDIVVRNGQLRNSMNDASGVTALAIYPKQPFDFTGRTGTVAFDVTNDTSGSHGAWPEFWISDQPVPVPFSHGSAIVAGNPNCDLCSLPRHAVGLDFSGGLCDARAGGTWSTSDVKIVRNYVLQERGILAGPGPDGLTITQKACVPMSSGPNGGLNHVEVRISQNHIDVYASAAGTSAPLKLITTIDNVNLSFTRGLIWLTDAHYNAAKAAGGGILDLHDHTLTWDNVAFDGPVTYRDISVDVPDNQQPTGFGSLVNLGWNATPTQPVALATIPSVTQAHLDTAVAANRGALLVFNFTPTPNGQPVTAFTYAVNGHAHTAPVPWPYPPDMTGWHSVALPVPLSDLVPGAQQLTIAGNQSMALANVNVVLIAAAAVP